MEWSDDFNKHLGKSSIRLEDIISFPNRLESASFSLRPLPLQSRRLGDITVFRQSFAYDGKFDTGGTDYRRFPFIDIQLPVRIELDAGLDFERLRLIPRTNESGAGSKAHLPGWLLTGSSINEVRNDYETSFGFDHGKSSYSQILFRATYQKSGWSSFWQLLQPIAVIMGMLLFIMRITSDFRSELPIALMMSLIFLQDGYKAGLPELPYLTFLDKIYAICYAQMLAAFLLALYTLRMRTSQALRLGQENIDKRAKLIESAWPLAFLASMAILITVAWF